MLPKGKLMHIDRTNQIAMSGEPARFAGPLPVSRLVFMRTLGTLTTRSSFRASEALDVGLCTFVGEIVNITPIFPQTHAPVVVASSVVVSHSMRIANEERANLVLNAEVDHFPGGLMALISNPALGSSGLCVFGLLQFLPTPGMLGTASLFLRNTSQDFAALTFERANTAPGDNQGFARVGRHGCQVNLA